MCPEICPAIPWLAWLCPGEARPPPWRFRARQKMRMENTENTKPGPGGDAGAGPEGDKTCESAPEPALPAYVPRWLGMFLGKQLLRVCPSARRIMPCEGCELRVLCKCAQEQLRAAAAIEHRIWMALAACGGVVILYVAVKSLRGI